MICKGEGLHAVEINFCVGFLKFFEKKKWNKEEMYKQKKKVEFARLEIYRSEIQI